MSFIKDKLKAELGKLEDKIKDGFEEKLDDPEMRQKVIDSWNDAVNIPILNENTEERIFAAIYDKFVAVIKKVL